MRIRRIEASDDPWVAEVIRTVMPEIGAGGEGFAIHDPEVDHMSVSYAPPRAGYWVIEREGRILGGGGFAQLVSGPEGVCELRKMYFLPELRGLGLGKQLLDMILREAKGAGYRQCYLETLASLTPAITLYRQFGFEPLSAPMGATGHFGCNAWFLREL
ncbi:MAG TPA: GNAT family N-acetyltransferase [Fimbriimonadaceae bacterium]|nr:GNAT family N-acetyltransferase [Fimbriimonadaceae bacterium]